MKAITILKALPLTALLCSPMVLAENNHNHQSEGHSHKASSHAPIGVMADHLHKRGDFMISYRAMSMQMEGNRRGTDRVSARSIVGTGAQPGEFIVAPTSMDVEMQMLGAMYGLSDTVTLYGMTSYISKSMDHLVRNGVEFTTKSKGIGDTRIGAMVHMFDNGAHKAHWSLGLSLPTGATDQRFNTPAQENAALPYPMQLGSGTFDLLPGVTYNGRAETLTWGVQASAVIRTGENDEDYTLGDRFKLTSWVAYDFSDNLSTSLRLEHQDWDSIDGANPELNPNLIQTADPDLQTGERTNLSVGVNYIFEGGYRLAFEYAQPIRQDLEGPQLESDSMWTLGFQKAF